MKLNRQTEREKEKREVCSSARRRRRGPGKRSHNAHFKPRTRSSSPRSSLSSPSSSSSESRWSSNRSLSAVRQSLISHRGGSGGKVQWFIYEGEFHKGRCNGSGVYEGDWIDGRYDGTDLASTDSSRATPTPASGATARATTSACRAVPIRRRVQYGVKHDLGCYHFMCVFLGGSPLFLGWWVG